MRVDDANDPVDESADHHSDGVNARGSSHHEVTRSQSDNTVGSDPSVPAGSDPVFAAGSDATLPAGSDPVFAAGSDATLSTGTDPEVPLWSDPTIGKKPIVDPQGQIWFRSSPLVLLRIFSILAAAIFWIIIRLISDGVSWSEIQVLLSEFRQRIFSFTQLIQLIHSAIGWGFIAICTLLILFAIALWLSWRMTMYSLDNDTFHLRSGVLFKRHTRLPVQRIQNVQITRSLLQRILGYSTMTVEVAGGKNSHAQVRYIGYSYAQRLRSRVTKDGGIDSSHLGLEGGIASSHVPMNSATHAQECSSPHTSQDVHSFDSQSTPSLDNAISPGTDNASAEYKGPCDTAPTDARGVSQWGSPSNHQNIDGAHTVKIETDHGSQILPVFHVATKDLFISVLLNGARIAFAVILVLVAMVAILTLGLSQSMNVVLSAASVFFGGFIAFLITLVSVLGSLWKEFAQSYAFRATVEGQVIRISRGLMSTHTITIPRHRIHAIHVRQTLLWRMRNYWKIELHLAGTSSASDEDADISSVLLPVGTTSQAARAVSMILNDFDIDNHEPILRSIFEPRQASQQWGGGAWVTPAHHAVYFKAIAPMARLLNPFTYRYKGIDIRPRCAIIRDGRWTHTVSIVAHSHVQAVSITRGPLERLCHVGSINFALVASKVLQSNTVLTLSGLGPAHLSAFMAVESELIRQNWTALADSFEGREAIAAFTQSCDGISEESSGNSELSATSTLPGVGNDNHL